MHLVLCSAVESNCSLSVGTIEPVAGFCWSACPGFREPAHLGQGDLSAQNAGGRGSEGTGRTGPAGLGWEKELSVGSRHLSHRPRQGLHSAGWHWPGQDPGRALGRGSPPHLLAISWVGPQGQGYHCGWGLKGCNPPWWHFLACVGAALPFPSPGRWALVWLPVS